MASHHEDSSESDGELEPAKCFHRRLSTNKDIKTAKCTKEGPLFKQTYSFQRWKRRYFKLKARKLYYSKDSKAAIYNEIDLIDTSVAECSMKNINHSFQVITPFRNLVLCAESRKEMEDWIAAVRSAAMKEIFDPNEQTELASDHHNWCALPSIRPLFCNVCTEALSRVTRAGVSISGLSCEVCKYKTHKRCAVKASTTCKWTTLASIGDDIIEDDNGAIMMPHQWMKGNLAVNAKCTVCDKTCGSMRRLQDWWCLWCHCSVHTGCRENLSKECSLGQCRISVLPPKAITNLDSDGFWRAMKPPGTSPLLVFLNSKSGDNQGVKMLRKFKQLLNPAQVFDLMNGGPKMGLRLFQNFESFRVLVCGGDGSIGWVLNEIDRLGLHKQCQVGVLPLGTGNDLARVLGWGATFDDDQQLPAVLEKLEHAQIKMLDRWSIYCYESPMLGPRRLSTNCDPISAYGDSASDHLSRIIHSDSNNVVISSATVLMGIVNNLVSKVAKQDDGSGACKCTVLNEKMNALWLTLKEESHMCAEQEAAKSNRCCDSRCSRCSPGPEWEVPSSESAFETILGSPQDASADFVPRNINSHPRKNRCTRPTVFRPREQLMSRANSLKKAIREIIEHVEKAVDEQNNQTAQFEQENMQRSNNRSPPTFDIPKITMESELEGRKESIGSVTIPDIPTIVTTSLMCEEDEEVSVVMENTLPSPLNQPTLTSLAVPGFSCRPSDGESSVCSTPGLLSPCLLTPDWGRSPVFSRPGFSPSPTPFAKSPKEGKVGAGGSRHISSLSMQGQSSSLLPGSRDRSPSKDSTTSFPLLNTPLLQTLPRQCMGASSNNSRSGSSGGGGFISKVLLANADALCAAASPLVDLEDINIDDFEERCVMNNYFGIGLDAKIALDFHIKREEHPKKCQSRTKNMMWYGVLGGREIVNKTYKNLEQRVRLECDGQLIALPNLQGIVVLNIPSYMGGTNFWGGTKEDDYFIAPSFDDNILEVVAVFGSVQLGISRVINLQRHRIAQCRTVRITIIGSEGVPVQVDGEAWVQPPGVICVAHKNRAQMLTRDKVFEEALKNWTEKQKIEKESNRQTLSNEEMLILHSFVDATEELIRSVRLASICNSELEQELLFLVQQACSFLDRLYPAGHLKKDDGDSESNVNKPANRNHVSDLVSSVRTLYNSTQNFMTEKAVPLNVREDLVGNMVDALSNMEEIMKKVYEIGGLPHFHVVEEEASHLNEIRSKEKIKFLWKFMKNSKKDKSKELQRPNIYLVREWSTEEVSQWLHSLDMDEYQEVFVAHDIRGRELVTLGRQDLKELGISKVGHLKRIQQAIKEIKDKMASTLDRKTLLL